MAVETTPAVVFLPVDALEPNDWNPNRMGEDEYAELLEEVRHLGRIPKPVVVRRNGDSYSIVDGEHGWRAACELGFSEVPCEVVEVDDFEAMRQTYKRNQHGTHDPVLLGQMFRRMLDERGLSNRALAEEIAVSEGTIRNALLYVEAASLRNDYAFRKLTLSQLRTYLRLPEVIRDSWLDSGAHDRLLDVSVKVRKVGARGSEEVSTTGDYGVSFEEIAEKGLDCLYRDNNFVAATQTALKLWSWRWGLGTYMGDPLSYLFPVAVLIGGSYRDIDPERVLKYLPLRERDGSRMLYCPITPERWALALDEAQDGGALYFDKLESGVVLALKEAGAWDEDESRWDRDPENRLAVASAPDYVREANITLQDKVSLARAKPREFGVSDEDFEFGVREALPVLEQRAADFASGDAGRVSRAWKTSADSVLKKILGRVRDSRDRKQKEALYESCESIVAEIVEQLENRKCSGLMTEWQRREATAEDVENLKREGISIAVGDGVRFRERRMLDGRPVTDILRERLAELPWPELVLLGCVVTGAGEPAAAWLLALKGEVPVTSGGSSSLKDIERVESLIADARGFRNRR